MHCTVLVQTQILYQLSPAPQVLFLIVSVMQLFETMICSPKKQITKHTRSMLSMYFSRELLSSETLHWPKNDDMIWTHSDDAIRVVETLNKFMTNPDVVIKTVKLMIFLKKAELRMNPSTSLSLLWGKTASLYTCGTHEQLSNISGISKWLLINESEELSGFALHKIISSELKLYWLIRAYIIQPIPRSDPHPQLYY